MSQIGVYFASWASGWTDSVDQMDLAQIDKPTTIVNISFVSPTCSYFSGQRTFMNTGLQFSQRFQVVCDAISRCKSRGIRVMLSVGGGSYSAGWEDINLNSIVCLMNDLGCDGLDIDYEPPGGIAQASRFSQLIPMFRAKLDKKYLSMCGWSTGAYGPDGVDHYKGMNIPGIVSHGSMLDWINIMAYDAGKEYDPLGAYTCYRIYYKGPLLLGMEVGKQGWGDALLTLQDVKRACQHVKEDGDQNGIFVWAYHTESGETPNFSQIQNEAVKTFSPPSVEPQHHATRVECPSCHAPLTLTPANE